MVTKYILHFVTITWEIKPKQWDIENKKDGQVAYVSYESHKDSSKNIIECQPHFIEREEVLPNRHVLEPFLKLNLEGKLEPSLEQGEVALKGYCRPNNHSVTVPIRVQLT